MGLFSLPPAQSRADLNLDMFLGGNDGGKVQKKCAALCPPNGFRRAPFSSRGRMKTQIGLICCRM